MKFVIIVLMALLPSGRIVILATGHESVNPLSADFSNRCAPRHRCNLLFLALTDPRDSAFGVTPVPDPHARSLASTHT